MRSLKCLIPGFIFMARFQSMIFIWMAGQFLLQSMLNSVRHTASQRLHLHGSRLSVFCRLFATPNRQYVDTFFQSLVQGTCFWPKPPLRDQSSMPPAPNVAFFVSILALAYTKDLNNTGEYKLLRLYTSPNGDWRSGHLSRLSPFQNGWHKGTTFVGLSLTSRDFLWIIRPVFWMIMYKAQNYQSMFRGYIRDHA